MNFPLSRQAGSIVFVDDDVNFLATIKGVMAPDWNIQTFARPSEFVDHIKAKVAVERDMDSFQRGSVERYRNNGSAAVEVFRYWSAFPERYSLPKVVVIDYYMPGLNGLEALSQLDGWSGKKILLTGVADETLVCKAFNNRVIDYYIPKQNSKLITQLSEAIQLMVNSFSDSASMGWNAWFMSMRPEQRIFLNDPGVSKALFEFVGNNHEHVAIGDPFGVMALGHSGGVKWLQLETTSTLNDAAALAANAGADAESVQAIRYGRALSNARINTALGLSTENLSTPVTISLRIPGVNETVYGAVFDLNTAGGPPPEMCYSAWHARQY
jgi:FixJ family two-component response regulator